MLKQKFTLFLTVLIDLLSFGIVIPILPNYVENLSGSSILPGVAVAVFSIAQFFFNPIWGAYSDRVGRRPVILLSLIFSVIGYFLFAYATHIAIILLSRIFCGIGAGNISAAQAYISDITEPKDRAKNMGMIGAAFGLGFMIGPMIGGVLMAKYGFASIGYFCTTLCLLNLGLAFFLLPESLDLSKEREIKKINILPLKAFWEASKIPNLRTIFISGFAFTAAFFFFQINAPLVWEKIYKLSAKEISILFSIIGISSFIAQGVILRITSIIWSERTQIMIGFVLIAMGIVMVPFTPMEYLWTYSSIGIIFISIGNGIVNPNLTTLVSKNVEAQNQGLILGIYQSLGALARIIGPVLGSIIYSINWILPFILAPIIYILNSIWFKRYKADQEIKFTS